MDITEMAPCCGPKTFADKVDRTDSFYSATQSICPKCRKTVQAKILFRDNKVILSKRCMEHGVFEGLLSSDIKYWTKSLTYTKPGTKPKEFSTPVEEGCPDDCGLCEDHEQHTCSPIIEISNKCNLQCPICIVWNQNSWNMSVDEFKSVIDGLIRKEGNLELCLLSGGEPTLHPDFFEMCEYATKKTEIKRVLISSHGLRFARDEEFVKRFKDLGLYLSLQFDSLKQENYKALRGKDLLTQKMKCLDMCEKYQIPVVFVPTVAKGFNDDEIGDVVDFALAFPYSTSVTIQPAAYTGAGGTSFPQDPMGRLTQVDIHRLLSAQTNWLKTEDFLPIPCSHPSCYTAAYMLKMDGGEFLPLNRITDVAQYLDSLTNRSIMETNTSTVNMVQDAVYNLWSAQSVTVDGDRVMNAMKDVLKSYDQSPVNAWKSAELHVKAVFIHAFMDEYDFEISRIRKCCTHYALPDGTLIPGCSYNNVHRMKQKFLDLKDVKAPEREKL